MKKTFTLHSFLILFFIFAFSFNTLAQTPTDGDYRTIASGTWSGVATWQVRTAGNWAATAIAPTLTATVYIQTGHTLTIDVATAACNDIHVHSSGVLAIGVNTIEVNGKLRAYTGAAVVAAGADGTFYSGQTSTATVGAVSISSTAGTGKMKFVGNTRTVTNIGEWGNNPQAWDAEFAPTAGQTLTIQTGFKANNITVSSGTVTSSSTDLRPDGSAAGLGTLTVKNGSTLQFSNPSINVKRVGAVSATSHFGTLTVEAGAILDFSGTNSPVIGASVFAFTGTVKYSGAGAQTLATKGGNSAGTDPVTYTNLTLSNTGIKTTAGALTTTINGTLSLQGTATVALGATAILAYGVSGTLEYAGSAAQTTGLTPVEWPTTNPPASLTINNANGVILNATAGRTIAGNLTLTNGLLTTTTLLTMDVTSTVAAVSNASFVNGQLKKIGNTDFTFPVGKISISGYVPIKISNFAVFPAATTAFTAEYIRSSAELLGPVTYPALNHVSRVDYWTLNNSGTTSPIVDITCYWTNESSSAGSASYINSLSDLIIAHFNGTNWDLAAPVSMVTGGSTFTAGSVVWPAVSIFSPFSLGSTFLTNPLPINLNYLNGYKQNGSHNLVWKVTCTNNLSATMSLERSADNRNFTGINSIIADALRCEQPFSYTDNSPLAGTNYYRLKMTDANGKVSYSAAIAILNAATGFDIVGLLPNLVNNNAVLNVTAAQKTKMDVVVTDIAGKQVQKIAYNLIAGSNQFNINLSNLSAGTYQITGYTAEGKSRTVRFVKQ